MNIQDVIAEAEELSRKTARDPKTAVALRRAYSKYPTAASDIEAYVRQEIEKSGEVDQDLDRQNQTNQRQDSYLSRLKNLTRKQSQQLKSLDDENDEQEREIQDLEQQLSSLAGKPATPAEPKADKKDKKPAEPASTLGPAFEPTPGQTRREKTRQAKATVPAVKAPAAPAKQSIDMIPSVKDPGDKAKAPVAPSASFDRMSQELLPRQRELPLDEPRRSRFDTTQATDVTPRMPDQLARDTRQKIQTYGPRLAATAQDTDAMRNFIGQQELELAEQLKTLAGIR